MKTKTWKIGEYAVGGIITVEIKDKIITIIGKEWDFSAGSNRGSNQSNAKEFDRLTVSIDDCDSYMNIDKYLNDLTTSYYADQILKWLIENGNLKHNMFWR